jgi:signal peptidase II
MTRRLRLGLATATAALIVDQAVKLWLLHVFELGRRGAVEVTPFFDLVLAWNTGISYGWFANSGDLAQAILIGFKIVAVLALGLWMVKADTLLATISLGLIVGGAIGNGIDRLLYGAVVDFVLLHAQIGGQRYSWYIFNMADAAIVVGVAGLLYDSFRAVPAVKAP